MLPENNQKFAIRFGLGAIKAVGLGMMEATIAERAKNSQFLDIYDFASRADPRSVNKKSIEALAKAGAFDSLHKNRRQISESFETLSAYSISKNNEASSSQMSLFGSLPEANKKPELKKISDWDKSERLQKEFEAFGFFLNEHPLDDKVSELKKRGVIFSDKLERDDLTDGDIIKMAGVVAGSKHRSSSRGRFAYLTISDVFGIFEAMIFDEGLITSARDLLVDGNIIALECLIRKDDGGVRISVREVKKLEEFIKTTKARAEDFEDIQKSRQNFRQNSKWQNRSSKQNQDQEAKTQDYSPAPPKEIKKVLTEVEITIKNRREIFALKALLSGLRAFIGFKDSGSIQTTRVYFLVIRGNKTFKIELAEKYLINEADLARLREVA